MTRQEEIIKEFKYKSKDIDSKLLNDLLDLIYEYMTLTIPDGIAVEVGDIIKISDVR